MKIMDEKKKTSKKATSGAKAKVGATGEKKKVAKLSVDAEFDGRKMTVQMEGNLTKSERLERMVEYSNLGSAVFNALCKGALERFDSIDCQKVILTIVDKGLKTLAEQEGFGINVAKFAENLINFNTKGKCVVDDEDDCEDDDDCGEDEDDDDNDKEQEEKDEFWEKFKAFKKAFGLD